jgi:hypothetical protein
MKIVQTELVLLIAEDNEDDALLLKSALPSLLPNPRFSLLTMGNSPSVTQRGGKIFRQATPFLFPVVDVGFENAHYDASRKPFAEEWQCI